MTVPSGAGRDSVSLSVRVHTPDHAGPHTPTVLMLHGYPDTQAVWEPVIDRLAGGHQVVTYDVRGAGGSSAPCRRAGYRTARLVDDLVAVLDRLDLPAPVHLVGHDWGSVQLWEAMNAETTDGRLRGSIASLVSISGPGLDHFATYIRLARGRGQVRSVRRQLRRSWYVAAFQLPVLPELAWTLAAPLLRLWGAGHGTDHWAPTLSRDARHGLGLYRANVARRPHRARPGGAGRTRLPVTVLVPVHDRFITPALAGAVVRANAHARRVDLDAGHWVIRTDPDRVAREVADHVRRVLTGQQAGG